MKQSILSLMVISLLLLGAGCSVSQNKPASQTTIGQVINNKNKTEPQTLPEGWQRRSVAYADGRNVSWIIAPLEKDAWRWTLANDPSNPQSVSGWRGIATADLVINGAYFDEKFQPAGYFKDLESKSSKPWPDKKSQTDPKSYSGLIRIKDGQLKIIHLTDTPSNEPGNDEQALLTYPTLVSKGDAVVKEDSKKYARRTILAQDGKGKTYAVIVESGAPSLYEASQWLATQPEKFEVAVNLDGGPSTGLSYNLNGSNFEIPSAPIPNVLTANHMAR
jgi:hypothetical protein